MENYLIEDHVENLRVLNRRLIDTHGENQHYDYMNKFREITDSISKNNSVSQLTTQDVEHLKFIKGRLVNVHHVDEDIAPVIKLQNLITLSESNTAKSDAELVAEIETYIRKACTESKYTHLCLRVETPGGMAYVINRCVKMMATDKIKLSTALATLENEFEGVN